MKKIRPKNNTAILAILLATIGLSVLPGCRNPLAPFRGTEGGERGLGTLSLSIGGRAEVARTIAPVWPGDEGLRLDLFFSPSHDCSAGNEPFYAIGWNHGDTVALYSGRWDLVVHAFRIYNDTATKIATGTRQGIEVETGTDVNVSVALQPIRDSHGIFTWAITILDHFEINPTESTLAIIPIDGGAWSHGGVASLAGSMSIPAGMYRVVFTLVCANGERENAVIRELLYVYGNMTSSFAETLGKLHFPTSLLSIILGAINAPAHGTIRTSLEEAGVRAGHFGLLGIKGVENLTDSYFHGFLGRFDTLLDGRAGPITEADLPNLADAALVAELTDRGRAYANRNAAETHIRGLAANGTFVSIVGWPSNRRVIADLAGFRVAIDFTSDVYDHRIDFDINAVPAGGLVSPGPVLAYFGQTLTLPGTPGDRSGFAFTGWNTQANGGGRQHLGYSPFTVIGDATLYATWALADGERIQVILASGLGSGADVYLTAVPPGTEIILPPLPGGFAKDGSFFTGWSVDGGDLLPVGSTFTVTGPGSRAVFTAQWETIVGEAPPLRTLRIEPNAEGAGAAIVMSVPLGTTVTLPQGGFVREWYDLLPRWYTQVDGGTGHAFGQGFTVTDDITLYARWYRPGYEVSFDVAGGWTVPGSEGGGTATRVLPRGTIIELPVLARTASTFLGWSTEIDGERRHLGLAPFLVVRHTELRAEWGPGELPMVNLIFVPNGGEGDDIVTTPVVGMVVTLPPSSFTRADHAFLGWRYDSPTGPLYASHSPFTATRDATMYAAWVPAPAGSAPPSTFTVRFNPNQAGGDSFSLMPVPQGTVVTLPGAGFTMHEHFLYGWSREAVGIGGARDYAIDSPFTVTEDLDLFAVWRFATVEEVTVSPVSVTLARGGTYRFDANVSGQGNPPQDVEWSLVGTVSPGTDISSGLLTVARGQVPGSGVLIVEARSPHDRSVVGTATVNVSQPTVTNVTLIPRASPAQAQRGGSVEFDLEISGPGYPGAGGALVEWSAVPRGEGYPGIFTGTIAVGTNQAGTLSIAPSPNQGLGYVDVRARVTNWATAPGGNATGTFHGVRIMPPTGFQVQIGGFVSAPVRVERGEGHQFSVSVIGGQGYPTQDVTWTVQGSQRAGTSVDESHWFNLSGTEPLNNAAGNLLTLRATSVCNPAIFGEVSVQMIGPEHLGNWRRVTAGVDHTMGITWDNRLYTWGNQSNGGQLGHLEQGAPIGGAPAVTSPRRLGDQFWRFVSGGWGHTTGIKMDGTLWEWGRWYGFHSTNITPGHNLPTQVRMSAAEGDYVTDWVYLVAGHGHNLAIRKGPNGEHWLYGWGNSREGRLGLGETISSSNTIVRHPTRVPVGDDWDSVSTGMWHSAGLRNGVMYVWGRNAQGQLGPGSPSSTPRPLETGDWPTRWKSVAVGGTFVGGTAYTVAICMDGYMYVWGSNSTGALSPVRGAPGNMSSTPRRVVINGQYHKWESVLLNGTRHVIAIDTNGVIWTWGSNYRGAIGDNGVTPTGLGANAIRTEPFPISASAGRTWIFSLGSGSASLAIDSIGDLWAWGHNTPHGQLGVGDNHSNRLVPTRAVDPPGWGLQ